MIYEKLEEMLPYTVEILSMLKGNTFFEMIEISGENALALKNNFQEWIGFSPNIKGVRQLIGQIALFKEETRIILFNCMKEGELERLADEIPLIKRFHLEDFMCCLEPEPTNDKEFRAASAKDLLHIAQLSKKYREIEISWKYYHVGMEELKREYLQGEKYKRVFGIGDPFQAIGELTAEYGSYKMLGRIYVDKEYRKRGIGKRLINGLTQYCTMNNCIPVLTVREDNETARYLYERCNFKKEGKVVFCYL